MNPGTGFHNLGRLMTWVATVLTRFSSQTALDASPKTSFIGSLMGWMLRTAKIRSEFRVPAILICVCMRDAMLYNAMI